MSEYAKEWRDVYNKSILAFTGRNKVGGKELEAVVTSANPFADALFNLDKVDFEAIRGADARAAGVKVFTTAYTKKVHPAAKKYALVLNKAIKTTDKVMNPDAYREVKVILAHLKWIDAKIANAVKLNSKDFKKAEGKANERIKNETDDARDNKKMDDNQVKAATDYAKQLKSLLAFPTACKTAAARAAVAIQTIKKDPTVATYNYQMDHGGRNYTQQVSNLIKLYRDAKTPAGVKKVLAGLDAYAGELDAYGNGAKRRMPDNSTPFGIKIQIGEYSKLVKATYPYAEKMMKFLKTKTVK